MRVTGSQDCTEDERQILCYDYTDPPLSVLTSHLLAGFHTMGGDEAMDKFEICMGANLTCMNDLMNRMGEFDHVDYKGKQTKCRSACEDQVRCECE